MRRAATNIPRVRIEAAVEALLALLDGMDGDPDLEPSLTGVTASAAWFDRDDHELDTADDEHTLGWSEAASVEGSGFGLGSDDIEPSLASLDQPDQRRWSDHDDSGRRLALWVDAEHQCEDEGADDEREPEPDDTDGAWAEAVDQTLLLPTHAAGRGRQTEKCQCSR